MIQVNVPRCYGQMFPDLQDLAANSAAAGKVFAASRTRTGGSFAVQAKAEANLQQWQECTHCPRFEHCYQLSTAKLLLDSAVREV